MASYEQFAQIYDRALNELPYEGWLTYMEEIFNRYQLQPKLVLDLGCGTGSMTSLMASKGYEMIGVDLSEDMLVIAGQKAKDLGQEVTYLQQDMKDLDLYGTVDAVISCGDALNYLLDEKDLLKTFERVNLFLNPGGLFVFDMNTIYKFKEVLGKRTYSENHEDYAYIWHNYYDEKKQINEYDVTIFIKNEAGLFDRTTEIHYERGYSPDLVAALIKKSGLKLEAIYHAGSFEALRSDTKRMHFVVREQQKSK